MVSENAVVEKLVTTTFQRPLVLISKRAQMLGEPISDQLLKAQTCSLTLPHPA